MERREDGRQDRSEATASSSPSYPCCARWFLSSQGAVMDADEFVYIVQQTAIAHRDSGDPNQLADAIHLISEHLHRVDPRQVRIASR